MCWLSGGTSGVGPLFPLLAFELSAEWTFVLHQQWRHRNSYAVLKFKSAPLSDVFCIWGPSDFLKLHLLLDRSSYLELLLSVPLFKFFLQAEEVNTLALLPLVPHSSIFLCPNCARGLTSDGLSWKPEVVSEQFETPGWCPIYGYIMSLIFMLAMNCEILVTGQKLTARRFHRGSFLQTRPKSLETTHGVTIWAGLLANHVSTSCHNTFLWEKINPTFNGCRRCDVCVTFIRN
jgi:hypothetical protein